jgi:hypothetical protein
MDDRFYDGPGEGETAGLYVEKEEITVARRPRGDVQEWVIGERVVVGVRFVW